MLDMTESIAPKSDQLNAEDLLSGPRTFTIKDVKRGTTEQPINVELVEFPGRPFKPSKTVRRIMVMAWGADASTYAGKRMTLYRDPTVRFGGMDVGGIRVSHMSDIDKPLVAVLAISKGKRAPHTVQPLPKSTPPSAPVPDYMVNARAATTVDEWRAVWEQAKAAGHLTAELKAELTPIGQALTEAAEAPAQPAPVAAEEDFVEEPPADWEPTIDGTQEDEQ